MGEAETFDKLHSKAANIKGYQITEWALSRRKIQDKLQKIEMIQLEQNSQGNSSKFLV